MHINVHIYICGPRPVTCLGLCFAVDAVKKSASLGRKSYFAYAIFVDELKWCLVIILPHVCPARTSLKSCILCPPLYEFFISSKKRSKRPHHPSRPNSCLLWSYCVHNQEREACKRPDDNRKQTNKGPETSGFMVFLRVLFVRVFVLQKKPFFWIFDVEHSKHHLDFACFCCSHFLFEVAESARNVERQRLQGHCRLQ